MKPTLASLTCFHCGDRCPDDRIVYGDKHFCCAGCRTVYGILHENDLDQYYCLNETPGINARKTAPTLFSFLDDPEWASRFITFSSPSLVKAQFYLPQIHCSSCLWLLEHLHKLHPGILDSRVNFMEKRVYLSFDPEKINLRGVAEQLTSLGYEPLIELNRPGPPSSALDKTAIQIGISGFCFANIMLLSFPEYFGLNLRQDGSLVHFFRYLNLGLGIPVFLIGLDVFFRNAWTGLKQKYLNIDGPVSLAILVTFIRSLVEILSGSGMGYLDSMSGIVFFMLVGRAFQNRTNKSLQFSRDYESYFPISVQVKEGDQVSSRNIRDVKKGDILLLKNGEILPVDGMLSIGHSLIDYSFITGESQPVAVSPGEWVYSGGRVEGSPVEILTVKPFSQSGFTQLWNNEVFRKEKNTGHYKTDLLAKYFTILVLGIAGTAFTYWQLREPSVSWNAFTAVLIVACPCALLLSSSFTYGHLIRLFSNLQFFVKNAAVIETLPLINHLVFDKTGTLTHSNAGTVSLRFMDWTPEEESMALSLMAGSSHPLSRSILSWARPAVDCPVASYREIPGGGIEGWVMDRHIRIGNEKFTGHEGAGGPGSEVYVSIDGRLKAVYTVSSPFKPGAPDLLQRLSGYTLSLLSGDRPESLPALKKQLPARMKILFGQSPQQKLDYIRKLHESGDRVLMVGDGLNDTGALRQSDIGLAVVDRHFSFSPACDILVREDRLKDLDRLIKMAVQGKYLIWAGFGYSIIYNVIGIYFAVTGRMSPLVAAILMPLSSIGVMSLAYLGVAWIGKRSGLITKEPSPGDSKTNQQ